MTNTSEMLFSRHGRRSTGESATKSWVLMWADSCSDFGLIFGELLPGNFAKLQPPEGQDLTEGLEVKVRLGSIWKASLTELSGGQR